MKNEQLMTIEEVATSLRVSRRAPYRWVREGKLPALRPTPGVIRIRQSDFERFVNGRQFPLEQER
jgi:excisionase family DNA binding protein